MGGLAKPDLQIILDAPDGSESDSKHLEDCNVNGPREGFLASGRLPLKVGGSEANRLSVNFVVCANILLVNIRQNPIFHQSKGVSSGYPVATDTVSWFGVGRVGL